MYIFPQQQKNAFVDDCFWSILQDVPAKCWRVVSLIHAHWFGTRTSESAELRYKSLDIFSIRRRQRTHDDCDMSQRYEPIRDARNNRFTSHFDSGTKNAAAHLVTFVDGSSFLPAEAIIITILTWIWLTLFIILALFHAPRCHFDVCYLIQRCLEGQPSISPSTAIRKNTQGYITIQPIRHRWKVNGFSLTVNSMSNRLTRAIGSRSGSSCHPTAL